MGKVFLKASTERRKGAKEKQKKKKQRPERQKQKQKKHDAEARRFNDGGGWSGVVGLIGTGMVVDDRAVSSATAVQMAVGLL